MSIDPRRARVQARLESLKARYRGRLRERLQELMDAMAKISGDGPEVEVARVLAHRLRGTAGTYGFDEVSAIAAEVEATLRIGGDFELAALALADVAAALDGAEERVTPKAEPRPRSPVRLLFCGGNVSERSRVDEICHSLKIRLQHSRSPGEAMERARDEPPDMLVVGMDGDMESSAKLARQIKALAGRLLPVVFLGDPAFDRRTTPTQRATIVRAEASRPAIRALVPFAQRPVVLVIDDDPDFAGAVTELLDTHGYGTRYEPDVTQALQTIREVDPAVILLDVAMRSLSGLDVCRAIRASTHRRVPVLFCTALVDPQIQIDCYRAGGDGWMAKPLRSELLRVRVDALVRRARKPDFGILPADAFLLHGHRVFQETSPNVLLVEVSGLHHVLRADGFEAVDVTLDGAARLIAKNLRGDDMIGRLDTTGFVVLAQGEADPIARRLEELGGNQLGDVRLQVGTAAPREGTTLAELVADCRAQIHR